MFNTNVGDESLCLYADVYGYSYIAFSEKYYVRC